MHYEGVRAFSSVCHKIDRVNGPLKNKGLKTNSYQNEGVCLILLLIQGSM